MVFFEMQRYERLDEFAGKGWRNPLRTMYLAVSLRSAAYRIVRGVQ